MKKDILKNLMSKFKKKGADDFKVNAFGKDEPRALYFNGNRKKFTPDMVAIYGDKKDLISVESKILKSELPNLIAKWILFGLEARRHGGDFYLVVEKKHSDQCKEIIETKRLQVELMTY